MALGEILLANGRGNHPDEQGNTPVQLMALMSEKHPPFATIVRLHDQDMPHDTPHRVIPASPELGTTSGTSPRTQR